jgi:hypothetical protein
VHPPLVLPPDPLPPLLLELVPLPLLLVAPLLLAASTNPGRPPLLVVPTPLVEPDAFAVSVEPSGAPPLTIALPPQADQASAMDSTTIPSPARTVAFMVVPAFRLFGFGETLPPRAQPSSVFSGPGHFPIRPFFHSCGPYLQLRWTVTRQPFQRKRAQHQPPWIVRSFAGVQRVSVRQ